MEKPFAVLLDRHADVLSTMGRDELARALKALARIVEITKIESVSDLELWVRSMEREAGREA